MKTTSPDGSVNQLIICKTDNNGYIKNIKTAVNKTSETYYVASDEEFVLNAHRRTVQEWKADCVFIKIWLKTNHTIS